MRVRLRERLGAYAERKLDPERRPSSDFRYNAQSTARTFYDLTNESETEAGAFSALLFALFRLVERR